MTVEFDVKLESKDMFRFNMYQTYSGTQGWISVIMAVLMWAMAVTRYEILGVGKTILYVGIGLLCLVYLPLTLYTRSKHSLAASEVLRETLHYAVDENGFKVSQGEANAELKWEQIYRMVATKSNVLVYTNRINAYVIPREQLGEKYVLLAELAKKQLPKYRVKMR